MTSAAELREDLEDRKAILAEQIESLESDSAEGVMDPDDLGEWRLINERSKRLLNAVEQIALPILEADPELVERIAGTIWKHDPQRLTGFAPDYLAIARTVLAAITTPTPGAE